MGLKTIPWKIALQLSNPDQEGTDHFSFCCFPGTKRWREKKHIHLSLSRTFLLSLIFWRGVAALSKQSPIKTPDSTYISKSITCNIRYEKEFVHILQTSELWSQLANTFGTEAGEKRYSAPTLRWKSSWSHSSQENSTTNSEWTSIPRIMLYYAACKHRIQTEKHIRCLGGPGSEYLLNQHDWWCKDWRFKNLYLKPKPDRMLFNW